VDFSSPFYCDTLSGREEYHQRKLVDGSDPFLEAIGTIHQLPLVVFE